MSRPRSAASTRAATLTEGVSCTSTVVAVPMTRWFVTTRPAASTMNPDARDSAVQMATTLSCHCFRSTDGSMSSGAADDDDAGAATISAFAAVRSRTASRPAAISTVRVH